MRIDEIYEFIKYEINEARDLPVVINLSDSLLGEGGLLDSMGLVQLCIALEDKAEDLGKEFDWASEKAMSKSQGMFRSVESLALEFLNQIGQR